MAKAPRLIEEDIEPYDVNEIQRLLKVVSDKRNGARWVVALALGLGQGECLGLKWSDVDLDRGTLRIRRGRLRPKDTERTRARQLWQDKGYVFTKPDSDPLNPNTAYHEWKDLLREAGLRITKLHAARFITAWPDRAE